MARPAYKRILLKLSGEGVDGVGPVVRHRPEFVAETALDRGRGQSARATPGYELCLVVGGGNIFRGHGWAAAKGMDRASADYMGMLATVMNALAVQNALEQAGVDTRVQSAIPDGTRSANRYIRRRAERHIKKGRVVIFAAGTGNPYLHYRHRGSAARGGNGV